MVDPSRGAENLVVAGLADVVQRRAQRARGSPLDQYLPWYIDRPRGTLSEKFTESLNSYAGVARVATIKNAVEQQIDSPRLCRGFTKRYEPFNILCGPGKPRQSRGLQACAIITTAN